ncbi:MAG: PilZ domain-containing protein [Myxococcota bacterium]
MMTVELSESERRRAPRFNVTFRLVCDDGAGYGNAVVVNLSESGALVESPRAYALGDALTLVPVGAAGDILFDIPGTVVRIVDDRAHGGTRRYGLQFFDLTDQHRTALRKLCRAMPDTPAELPLPEQPDGGPPREGGNPHHRIRTRFTDHAATPRWSRRPFR